MSDFTTAMACLREGVSYLDLMAKDYPEGIAKQMLIARRNAIVKMIAKLEWTFDFKADTFTE